MFSIQQFVPSEVCLKCDGCCRFKEPGTIWRPKMSGEETARATSVGLAEKILGPDILDGEQFIRTKPGCGEHLCQFFNPEDHACAIYKARPFECELYPFVISKDGRGAALYMHLNCPHVQENFNRVSLKVYVKYLKEFFAKPDVRAFLQRNRGLLNDYSAHKDELELVFVLENI